MSSKKRGDAVFCERNVIHGVVLLLKDEIEFEYDVFENPVTLLGSIQSGRVKGCYSDDDDLDKYILSIIGNISKEKSQQALFNTMLTSHLFIFILQKIFNEMRRNG
ncbi:hypothetical protein ACOSP7_016204 [Xanthoceras sorbifolium]